MILIRPQIFADKEYFILYIKIINLRVSVAKKEIPIQFLFH